MPTRFRVLCILLSTLVGVRWSAQAQQADFNKPFPPHKVIGMALEQDVPALRNMRPGNRTHPIDRVLRDGEEVKLGGTTLVAHRSFKTLRALPVDVFLGAHGSFYGMTEKYGRMGKPGANPFIDPDGYKAYLDRQEKNFLSRLEEQRKAPPR